jgi:rfaE bifunctional protein kinase chain/domain
MNQADLSSILSKFADLTILVLGDYFLDRYLMIDTEIAETSVETGREAHQVVEIRNSPGAAGTVTNNLKALGVGKVIALGIIGNDGHGYDLEQSLLATGVETDNIIRAENRYTPTYTKPIRTSTDTETERLDVKNRSATPIELETRVIERLESLYDQADGIIVLDQVQETDCGVVTSRVRTRLAELCAQNDRPVLADSRSHISEFTNTILKPNQDELAAATQETEPTKAARSLSQRTERPVILTRGPDGITTSDGTSTWAIPGIPVPDPVDIVGAGDSVSAAVTSALAAGTTLPEAALLGVIVSSITVQQIGTTGTASPDQVLSRFTETHPNGFSPNAHRVDP